MLRTTAIVSFFMVLSVVAFGKSPVVNTLDQGIYLYEHRADGASGLRPKSETINESIEHLEAAYQSTQDKQAGLYLMRAYNFQGRFVMKSKAEKRAVFEKGKNLGEALLKVHPSSPEVRLEYVYLLGLWGDNIGIMKAATSGIVTKMKEQADYLIKHHPNFQGGAGYQLLGVLHYKAPSVPFVLTWPDPNKGISLLEKAVKIDPGNNANVYYLAEGLYAIGENEQAKTVLERMIKMPLREAWVLEDKQCRVDGRALLREING